MTLEHICGKHDIYPSLENTKANLCDNYASTHIPFLVANSSFSGRTFPILSLTTQTSNTTEGNETNYFITDYSVRSSLPFITLSDPVPKGSKANEQNGDEETMKTIIAAHSKKARTVRSVISSRFTQTNSSTNCQTSFTGFNDSDTNIEILLKMQAEKENYKNSKSKPIETAKPLSNSSEFCPNVLLSENIDNATTSTEQPIDPKLQAIMSGRITKHVCDCRPCDLLNEVEQQIHLTQKEKRKNRLKRSEQEIVLNDTLQEKQEDIFCDSDRYSLSTSSLNSFSDADVEIIDNFDHWHPTVTAESQLAHDDDFVWKNTKVSGITEFRRGVLTHRWRTADEMRLSEGDRPSSKLVSTSKSAFNEDSCYEEQDLSSQSLLDLEKAKKRRIKEIRREIKQATDHFKVFGEWIRKEWVTDEEEKRMWDEAEAKVMKKAYSFEGGEKEKGGMTLEEVRNRLNEAEELGLPESEIEVLRRKMAKLLKLKETEEKNQTLTSLQRYKLMQYFDERRRKEKGRKKRKKALPSEIETTKEFALDDVSPSKTPKLDIYSSIQTIQSDNVVPFDSDAVDIQANNTLMPVCYEVTPIPAASQTPTESQTYFESSMHHPPNTMMPQFIHPDASHELFSSNAFPLHSNSFSSLTMPQPLSPSISDKYNSSFFEATEKLQPKSQLGQNETVKFEKHIFSIDTNEEADGECLSLPSTAPPTPPSTPHPPSPLLSPQKQQQCEYPASIPFEGESFDVSNISAISQINNAGEQTESQSNFKKDFVLTLQPNVQSLFAFDNKKKDSSQNYNDTVKPAKFGPVLFSMDDLADTSKKKLDLSFFTPAPEVKPEDIKYSQFLYNPRKCS
ncbi:uncharacterized protein MONOS_3471 [Monocercomonoides exilis]|uniref:uncharacterized protein n=1 Tax=Monocercomonoides exilis TaxID=2049356 RepID=UPI00355A7A09|nr:hypothetical protein MONOS_3471 [Monocercomonoides exilis]|eukprot:MONOS_3471.1-p1 / transcript=MONOS_3471.1 / gene=MONOS_3471 / organism=Monocercomonoides_exilis_PA203 / gene_product=unspecified product / transcript_product=unspecified product / location=Mono_scaffold00082:53812-56460(+) / protein_length=846 / sequence_SO=supercontig / SO=protein_coding / is_pseudo=false